MAAKGLAQEPSVQVFRAITLIRPWPYTIFHLKPGDEPGPKRIENRPNKPPQAVRDGLIAFHAGKKWDSDCGAYCRQIGVTLPHQHACFPRERGNDPVVYCHPESVLVGVVRVVGWVEGEPRMGNLDGIVSAFSGVSAERAREVVNDPWYFGPFGWVLDDVQTFTEPVPHTGAQGLWIVDPPAAERALAQLERRSP
jgi:hypothetical protein